MWQKQLKMIWVHILQWELPGIFFFHMLENIGMTMGLLPITGVPLPFISYGGTSVIFLMAEMGLVLSVSKGIKLENI